MSRLRGTKRQKVMKNVLLKSTVTVLIFAPKPSECDLWGRFTLEGFFIPKFIYSEKDPVKDWPWMDKHKGEDY